MYINILIIINMDVTKNVYLEQLDDLRCEQHLIGLASWLVF